MSSYRNRNKVEQVKKKKLDFTERTLNFIGNIFLFFLKIYVFPNWVIYMCFYKWFNTNPFKVTHPLNSHAKHPAALVNSFFVWYTFFHLIKSVT